MSDTIEHLHLPEDESSDRLAPEFYMALVALGWKIPTSEQEVALAELAQEMENEQTPIPEHLRMKRQTPDQVRTKPPAPELKLDQENEQQQHQQL
jgi:hypothetical protein